MTRRRSRTVWWTHPAVVLSGVTMPLVVLAHATPAGHFLEAWRTPHFLTRSTFWLFSATIAALVTGVLAAELCAGPANVRRPAAGPGLLPALEPHRRLLERAATALHRLTLAGYAAWVGSAVLGGVRLSDVLLLLRSGDTSTFALRDRVATVPGVTTLTQFGIVVVVLSALELGGRSTARRRIVLLVVLAALRGWLLNERLALIEVVVPLGVVRSMLVVDRRDGWQRMAVLIAPVVVLPSLLVGFAAFEHSRSWTWYQQHTDMSFSSFAVARLGGYYLTAFNNGALALEHDRWDGRLPHDSVAALWELPGVDQALSYESVTGRDFASHRQGQFARLGNDEFNSPSGLATPLVDLGTVAGLTFLLGVGVVIGTLRRSFAAGRLSGVLLFPVIFTGLLELPRYLYWTAGRAAPALGALALLSLAAARADQRLHRLPLGDAAPRARRKSAPTPLAGPVASVTPLLVPDEIPHGG